MNSETVFTTKKALVLGIILIVLLLIVGLFLFLREKKTTSNQDLANFYKEKYEFKSKTQQLAENELLSGFPVTFPKEADSKILQNYESTSNKDNRVQSTKKFTSKMSAQAALIKYANFFEDLGWKRNTTDQIASPALFTKDSDLLMIVTTPGSESSDTVVEITIVQSNVKKVK